MNILEVKNLSKRFRTRSREICAVDNISFNLKKNEILAILGPNGAGKTSLISCICSLIKPTSGEIIFQEKNIYENISGYRKDIGVVLEGSRNIYWYMSALENLKYFGRLMCLDDKYIEKRSEELLSFFDLWQVRKEKVGAFSRGMQQKVAISIAFLNEPSLLFLDEPSIGLDTITKINLIDKLKALPSKNGTTIILTSHQLDVVEKLANRILFLENGKMNFIGLTHKLKDIFSTKKLIIDTSGVMTEEQQNRLKKVLSAKKMVLEKNGDRHLINIISSQIDRSRQAEAIKLLVSMEIAVHGFHQQETSLEDIYIELFEAKN